MYTKKLQCALVMMAASWITAAHASSPPLVLPPDPFTAGATCHGGVEPTGFVEDVLGGTEVHIFGVYESAENRGFQQHPRGDVDVTVARTGVPITLVLSSYEPTHWRLNVAPGVQLQRVILQEVEREVVEHLLGHVRGHLDG